MFDKLKNVRDEAAYRLRLRVALSKATKKQLQITREELDRLEKKRAKRNA